MVAAALLSPNPPPASDKLGANGRKTTPWQQ